MPVLILIIMIVIGFICFGAGVGTGQYLVKGALCEERGEQIKNFDGEYMCWSEATQKITSPLPWKSKS